MYATTRYTYDFVGELTRLLHPDGVTSTTLQYDMAGRKTSMADPDLGSETYGYDPNGNLVQSVDARGAAGTVFIGYDGLDRPLWHNTTNSPTGAYYTSSYDSTAGGNAGIGRLTGETFSGGSMTGGYAFVYDGRGRRTGVTLTVGAASYPVNGTFDDAGELLTAQYPDGETVTYSRTGQGWLAGLSTSQGTTTTTLLSGATYGGVGGAFGDVTGASLGGGTYTYSAVDDLIGRPTDTKVTRTGGGATLFEQALTFDAAGNVATASTTLPGGTDNQAFCYDEQNRLTWAGSVGTPPCTGGAIGAGTLSAAQYTQSFTYDVMGRLTSGPLGSYTYGSGAHVHAATAVGTGYTASYDAAGNMTCRAPTSATTCAGASPTGAQLSYDPEGQLVGWQSAPSSPTSTAQFLYDCQGQRVAQRVTQSGTTTTTVYVGGVEEISTSGSTTTTTTYYSAGGKLIAMAVNGAFSYLATDGLGSANVVLNAGGSAVASRLYAPYGGIRYTNGTLPTAYGFTGQRADAVSGLDYYGARYYDPVAGQFTSADTVVPGDGLDAWGLSRFAYTGGNPTSRTDPRGHDDDGFDGGSFDVAMLDTTTFDIPADTGDFVGFDRSFLEEDPSSFDPSAGPPSSSPDTGPPEPSSDGGPPDDTGGGPDLSPPDGFGGGLGGGLPPPAMIGAIGPLARALAAILGREATRREVARMLQHIARLFGEAIKQAIEKGQTLSQALRKQDDFRKQLEQFIGPPPAGKDYDAHHIFPLNLAREFQARGIDPTNPRYGTWWESGPHQDLSGQYQADWEAFLQEYRTTQDVLDFGKTLGGKYGFDVYY